MDEFAEFDRRMQILGETLHQKSSQVNKNHDVTIRTIHDKIIYPNQHKEPIYLENISSIRIKVLPKQADIIFTILSKTEYSLGMQYKKLHFVESNGNIKHTINDNMKFEINQTDWDKFEKVIAKIEYKNLIDLLKFKLNKEEIAIYRKLLLMRTAVIIAANTGNIDYVKLLSYNARNRLYQYLNLITDINMNHLIMISALNKQFEMVKYLLECDNANILKLGEYKNFVGYMAKKPNAFYDVIKLQNVQLFDELITIKKKELSKKDWRTELNASVSKAYEELVLKSVPLNEKIVYRIQQFIVDIRFQFVKENKNKNEEVNNKIVDVEEKIVKTCELVKNMIEYFGKERKVDHVFMFWAKQIAQNIYVIKYEKALKSLPLNKIEFCLGMFLLTFKSDIETLVTFDVENLLDHLKELKEALENKNYNKQFDRLLKDYNSTRDVYSLHQIKSQLILVNSIDLDIDVDLGRAIIEKALRVLGENLKTSKLSPNISEKTLKIFKEINCEKVIDYIYKIRDHITHGASIKPRHSIFNDGIKSLQNSLKEFILKIITVQYLIENEALSHLKSNLIKNDITGCVNVKIPDEFAFIDALKKLVIYSSNSKIILERVYKYIPAPFDCKSKNDLIDLIKTIRRKHKKTNIDNVLSNLIFKTIDKKTMENYYDKISNVQFQLGICNKSDPEIYYQFYNNSYSSMSPDIAKSLQDYEHSLREAKQVNDPNLQSSLNKFNKINNEFPYENHKRNLALETIKKETNKNAQKRMTEDLKELLAKYRAIEKSTDINDVKLQNVNELYINDLLELIKPNLAHDYDFFDACFPIPLGKTLRNYCAHDSVLIKTLPINLPILLNKFMKQGMNLIKSNVMDCVTQPQKNQNDEHLNIVIQQERLFACAQNGSLIDFKSILSKNTDLNGRSIEDFGCLEYAAIGNKIDIFTYCLLNTNMYDINTLILHASANGSIDILNILFKHRLFRGFGNIFPLHLAIMNGHINIVKILIDKGIDINTSFHDLHPLTLSVLANKMEIFKLLLLKNPNKTQAIKYAAIIGDVDYFKILYDQHKNVAEKATNLDKLLFLIACRNGHINIVDELLDRVSKETLYYDKQRAIHYVARYGQSKMLTYLIQLDAVIDCRDVNGYSALHVAAMHDQTDCLKRLVDYHALIDAETNFKTTALHLAARHGSVNAVKFLLKKNAKLKHSIITEASKNGHSNIVEILKNRKF